MIDTFLSYSFGCRVNLAEKEEIDRQLLKRGLSVSEIDPKLYILNTCSVTRKAEREAVQHINKVKRKFPQAKIIVTGCAATNWNRQGRKIEKADLLIDNNYKEYLVELMLKRLVLSTKDVKSPERLKDKFIASGLAVIKIQDGCHRFCTFCIVPYLRGLPKSIDSNSIVEKINKLGVGVKEVILTAINTQAYGYDSGETFTDLVKKVLEKTTVERLSFGSVHPWSLDKSFYSLIKNNRQRLVKFFHIPLQSGSNKILSLMKRGYTRDEFIEKLGFLRKIYPTALIGTDIIVGFLEETDRDFEDTFEFLKKTPINRFHVFRYSVREHTAGYYLKKRLTEPSPRVKVKRAKLLAALSQKKYYYFLKSLLNKTYPALLLEAYDQGHQKALLDNQVSVLIKTEKKEVGQICNVEVIDIKEGQLFGKIV